MDLKENSFKPISFWSWNGLMEEQELRRQIIDFKEKGFGGFFIHSRAGRLIPYMGEQWLNACKYAVDEAKKQGIDVWLYDEDGWPSGFAGGLVNGNGRDYWAKHLIFDTEIPNGQFDSIICSYKKNGSGYKRVDNTNEADLFCIEHNVPTYVDLMNPKVTKEFIKVTHKVYKEYLGEYFGKTVKGIFTDEPQLVGEFPWSESVRSRFSEEYGEDILDGLWQLYIEDGGYSFKYRYRRLTNILMCENFVRPINEWCNRNCLIMTGHFGCEDGLVDQLHSNGGVMPLYNDMGMPGIDHLGNRYASVNLMKQVTSVAHRRGLKHVLSESFGCSGWNVTFNELMSVAGWQAAFGVNTICMHLSAYTIIGRRKRDYPAFFSYQEPWWQDIRLLNEAIKRLNSCLSAGKRITHVAVIHPMASAWCLGSDGVKYISSAFRELQNHLTAQHIDYDLIDEAELATAKIESGCVKAGNQEYNLIIVPECFTLSASTVEKLDTLAKQNGIIYFIGGKPKTIEGNPKHLLLKNLNKLPSFEIQNSLTILQKVFRANPVERPYDLLDFRMINEAKELVSYYVQTCCGAYMYCFNRCSDGAVTTQLRHKGHCSISEINLFSGEKIQLHSNYDGLYTYTELTIGASGGKLIEICFNTVQDVYLPKTVNTSTLSIKAVTRMSQNVLTLDVGQISLSGEEFSSEKYVINCADEIYKRMNEIGTDATLLVRYSFNVDFQKKRPSLYLAFEKNRYVSTKVNGLNVEDEVGWFIDKGIGKFDISSFVHNGENTVTMRYIIPNTHEINDLENKFESERNRFFYSVEPENVYILGDFDINCNGKIVAKPNVITVIPQEKTPTFVLTDPTEKKGENITCEGLWFYRGDVSYETEVEYRNNGRYYISLPDFKGVFVSAMLGEQEIGNIFSLNDRLEITDYLHYGKNVLRLVLRGSNRNLLGPHHHITGEPNFVGPSTFSGVRGFEDFITPEINSLCTYTNNYAFVPFGIGKIILTVEN